MTPTGDQGRSGDRARSETPIILAFLDAPGSSALRGDARGSTSLASAPSPALEVATGRIVTDLRSKHTSRTLVACLNKINRKVLNELEVHVIFDNLATHKTPTVQKWLLRHRRFHFHFTPTGGSWMNLVERWFSALTSKPQRSTHRSVKELAADIRDWVDTWHENPTPFVWHKTSDQILERLASYCSVINQGADT